MTVKKWLLIGAGVVVVAVLVIANLSRSSTPSVKARTAKVERGEVTARTNAPGKVEAVASVDLSAEVPGRVQTLHIAEGDSVKKDDLLLVLDAEQYRSRVAQADAGLNSTWASLRLAEAQLDKLWRQGPAGGHEREGPHSAERSTGPAPGLPGPGGASERAAGRGAMEALQRAGRFPRRPSTGRRSPVSSPSQHRRGGDGLSGL
jgi:multidrug efflux pump subunit AcrA (membrane-fusion protein)